MSGPFNEEQAIVDHAERDYGDEFDPADYDPADDFDWSDE
jgi:hypothetical protein